nr:uncharacterized protein CTRU02_12554 [Colletotrichum truncatum]KAF6784565.1 hypothetical protein CTRU02_12554 [Colletotrichum truncatum]
MEEPGILTQPKLSNRNYIGDVRNIDNAENRTWTSARCRRLLRPLHSRIIALRKAAAVGRAGYELEPCQQDEEVVHQPSAKRRKVGDSEDNHENQRKRPHRTYSRKLSPTLIASTSASHLSLGTMSRVPTRAQQKPQTSQPGIPNVSTPILRKVRCYGDEFPPSTTAVCQEARDACLPPRMAKRGGLDIALSKLQRARHLYPASRYQLYEGILHDLDALLRATSFTKPSADRKSLLSFCLRKMPDYAAHVDAWEKLNTPIHGPVSSIKKISYSIAMYDELEILGGAGNGWSHLWVLLRAHAVHLLRAAITDGTLDTTFAYILIDYCKKIDGQSMSAELIEAVLSKSYSGSSKSNGTLCKELQSEVLLSLADLADNAHITSHLFENVSLLLLRKQLPCSILSSKAFGSLWTKAASSTLDEETNPSGIRFTSTGLGILSLCSFPKCSSYKSRALRNGPAELTLASVLGAVSAMAMVSQDFGGTTNETEVGLPSQVSRVISQILQEALALVTSKDGSVEARYPLLLALFLSSGARDKHNMRSRSRATLKAIWFKERQSVGSRGSGNQRCRLYDATIALACSIAHCCGKATGRPSSYYFATVCDLIDQLQVSGLATLQKDGAFLLAQKTDDLRDLVFAETLAGVLAKRDTILEGIGARELFAGYRWEEGISEWIAASPGSKRRNVAQVALRPCQADGENEGKEYKRLSLSESEPLMSVAGGSGKSGCLQPATKAADTPNPHQGNFLKGRERRAGKSCYRNGTLGKVSIHVEDGVDELSKTSQESWSRAVGCCPIGSRVISSRGECRHLIRSGKMGRRKVLADLSIMSNMTGHSGDDDELGL